MGAVIASNRDPNLQMKSVGSHSTSGREREGERVGGGRKEARKKGREEGRSTERRKEIMGLDSDQSVGRTFLPHWLPMEVRPAVVDYS